jgi:tryptophan synthase alpha chain
MSRIQKTFANLKAQNKKAKREAFVSFLTAGDPDYQTSLQIIKKLPQNGVDIIELGIPFLDPAGDGPTIEEASKRAVKNGMNLAKTLQLAADFRQENNHTPIVLMGYYNPILQFGLENFCQKAAKSGVDALLVVDLPPEEDAQLRNYASQNGIDFIKLVTLTSDEERIKKIAQNASGFLYLVSILGITGTKSANLEELQQHLAKIKKISNLPVAIGFGIKSNEQVQEMSKIGADAVVVGSALVKTIADNLEQENIADLVIKKLKRINGHVAN